MILSWVMIWALCTGAVFLVWIEKALSVESSRFYCASERARLSIRVYAAFVAFRAFCVFAQVREGNFEYVTLDAAAGAVAMCACLGTMLRMLLNARLPAGVWPRIQRRLEFVKSVARHTRNPRAAELAADGAGVAEVLMADGVTVNTTDGAEHAATLSRMRAG